MSARRPLIGLTTYVEYASWGKLWRSQYSSLLPQAYAELVERSGGLPVQLPPADSALAPQLLARLDGVILTGGPDVDPARYGAEPHPATGEPATARDAWETAVALAALDSGTPLLGVCRGMQLLNVALGGTLDQHLPDTVGHDAHNPTPGAFTDHPVEVLPGTALAGIIAPGEPLSVPTHHHQAVDKLGSGLRVSAQAADGVPEALELTGLAHPFALAVQWHPEQADDLRVVRALVEAARG